ncbi:CSLREA domain protein [Fuerstiella marisgermanici]|uniref:CSLREA domain protein n=1 Tax=Fuerstiella marisgermanici TaxID=1891926 RepID=A0A1P8WMA8_9PLAN|nr:CSLREA domain protein [Fuerstiella marisgermanici]
MRILKWLTDKSPARIVNRRLRSRAHQWRRPQTSHVASCVDALEDRTLLTLFTVTTLEDTVDADDGQTSLREAIAVANGTVGHDEIAFAPELHGTIHLVHGALPISDDITITGSPSAALVIDAQKISRVLLVTSSAANVTLDTLNITNGLTTGVDDAGGGVRFEGTGPLTISNVTVAGNTTQGVDGHGGGIYAASGDVAIVNSTIAMNSAAGEGQGQRILSCFAGKDLHQIVNVPSGHSSFHDVALFARMFLDEAECESSEP